MKYLYAVAWAVVSMVGMLLILAALPFSYAADALEERLQ